MSCIGGCLMANRYELIVEYIHDLVKIGELRQGQRLPSIRELATKFNCNKATVIRAYDELEINHKVYSIPKSGYYLVDNKSENSDKQTIIDFSETAPDPKLLPYKEFNHSINRAIELYKNSLFSYTDAQGLNSLRKVLVQHFSENQIFTTEEKIFITSGSQQALSILSKMPFPNGKKNILVEQPTYWLIHELVELNGNKLIGINRNYEGINFHELEEIFKKEDIKFFYSIPRFHNPLGTSYSEKEKKKIVDLAQKYDVYIVEDDYLADLDKNKKSLPMHYYDVSEKVIYVKSFSKVFMPGIRIGAVVLHDKLKSEFLKHKKCYDLNTSTLAQGGLEIFINSCMYKNHIKKTQIEYKKKMDSLKRTLKFLDTTGIDFFVPETGFYIWIRLPKEVRVDLIVEGLKEKKVYISHGRNFFIGENSSENSFRICISKLSVEEIKRGVEMVFEEFSSYIIDKS